MCNLEKYHSRGNLDAPLVIFIFARPVVLPRTDQYLFQTIKHHL
jgi:hypothetical protein